MGRKKENKIIYKIIIAVAIIIIALLGIDFEDIKDQSKNLYEDAKNYISGEVQNTNQTLQTEVINGENIIVHFIDVGQADSILVQSDGKNMLIDAGTNETGKTVVKYLNDLGISKIDYLVGTHPHEDHIGGLDDVIDNFEIGTIYMPKVQTNTKTFESVLDSVAKKNLKITSPNVGEVFELGNAKCEIMACGTGSTTEKKNLNLSSIVIRMVYGTQSFLFTGDMEVENEQARNWPETTVLKVAHHGSDTSSSENFLEQVHPKIAVISVGKDNSYGHPKQTTLEKLNKLNTKVYRTDLQGTIVVICDGKECKVKE